VVILVRILSFAFRKSLLLTSLLIIVLVSFGLISVHNNISFFTSGTADKTVSNEIELRNAINVVSKKFTVTIDNDITLTNNPLTIPNNKDITLTSSKTTEHNKLIGADTQEVISIENGGVLRLDGICVTHAKEDLGKGIFVQEKGKLVMYSGEISANNGGYRYEHGEGHVIAGGGVWNYGVFEMSGGTISDNKAPDEGYDCGGVQNGGSFIMSGGTISKNTVTFSGGGVYNYMYNKVGGSFIMSGGTISDNTVINGEGGGVCNSGGKFVMSGGTISDNTANSGGGVYSVGSFTEPAFLRSCVKIVYKQDTTLYSQGQRTQQKQQQNAYIAITKT